MPYIKQEARRELVGHARRLGLTADGPGELNFVITTVIAAYLFGGQEPHYEDYNDVLGVLVGVILEVYRRKVAPYEDMKKEENGDVY